MNDNQNIYNQKVERILDTVNHKKTQQVPSMTMFGTWAVANAGLTMHEVEENPELEIEAYSKPYERIYADVSYTCGIGLDHVSSEILGAGGRFISPDGQTIQHKEICPMTPEDYPKLINDPISFISNEILPRKAENLSKSYEESYETLKKFINYKISKKSINNRLREKLKTDYAVPVLAGATVKPPMDIIFDTLRGFSGVSSDMRRHAKEFKEAILALEGFADNVVGTPENCTELAPFPFYATMMHVPTFISPKQFAEFFWPTYEKTILKIEKLGGKLVMFLEGEWKNKFDTLNDLPANFAIGIVEGDDIFETKNAIGKNIALAGGMPLQMLKFDTKEKCREFAKKLLDECACDGGYIFTSSRELISGNDINFENLIDLHDFVRNYRG